MIEEEDINKKEEEEVMDDSNEQRELGAYPPLRTLLKLTSGPLISQLVLSFYGLMNSFWISRSIGEKGMTTMSLVALVDFINYAFAEYFHICVSERVSFLFGSKQQQHATQVVVDILRYIMIFGLIMPAILIPCAKPLVKFYGANDEIADMCMNYLYPQLCCCFINYTYIMLCGLLQAMGKTVLYGICQVSSSLMTMFIFDPLFLIGLKSGMWGASVANTISALIPASVLYIMLFAGKFTIKPKFNMYLKKFNPHSVTALKVSISQLIENLGSSLPLFVIAKFVSLAANKINKYEPVMASWNILDRLYQFTACVCNALNQGFLPAGSYAFGANRLHRLFKLMVYSFLLGTAWSTFFCITLCVFPRQIASIWGKDEEFLYYAKKMIIPTFCTAFINMGQYTFVATMQATKMVKLSIIASILTILVPTPIFSTVLYYTNKNDPVRLMYSYIGHDLWAFCVIWGFAIWKLGFLCKAPPSDVGDMDIDDDNIEKELNPSTEVDEQVHKNSKDQEKNEEKPLEDL